MDLTRCFLTADDAWPSWALETWQPPVQDGLDHCARPVAWVVVGPMIVPETFAADLDQSLDDDQAADAAEGFLGETRVCAAHLDAVLGWFYDPDVIPVLEARELERLTGSLAAVYASRIVRVHARRHVA